MQAGKLIPTGDSVKICLREVERVSSLLCVETWHSEHPEVGIIVGQ